MPKGWTPPGSASAGATHRGNSKPPVRRETNIRSAPNGAGFENYADALAQSGAAAVTIVAYLERILAGHRAVITPGWDSLACRLVIDDWTGRSENEASRKAKTQRIVGASTLYQLGLDMIEEARDARFIGLHTARLFRNGLLLAVGVSLPQRARALSRLEFGKTIFLESDHTIRVFLPGQTLKRRETRKLSGKPYARTFRNPALWQALRDYREIYRPLYDDGDWLWPSQLSRSQGISEKQVGRLCGDVTERRLKVRVSVHDLRDNVVSEATEEMEHGGRLSPILLDHTDPRVTEAHYDQSEDISVAQEFGRFMQSRRSDAEPLRL